MGFFQDLLGGGSAHVSGLENKRQSLVDRGTALYDTYLNGVKQAAVGGGFDPNQRLDDLAKSFAHGTGLQLGNQAASARALGYRPGDSAPLQAQRAISEASALNYAQAADQIRTDAEKERLAAWNGLAGAGGSLLGQGINAYDNEIQQRLAQQQQSSGLFGTLLGTVMPFLGGSSSLIKSSSGLPKGVTTHPGTPFVW